MMREGVGLVAPTPVTVQISPPDVSRLRKAAAAIDRHRRYRHRPDAWGAGLIDNPTFRGKVGELAFARFASRRLGLPVRVNTDILQGGNGGVDFNILGVIVQVKTRVRRGNLLVCRETEDGRLLPIQWHACVAVTWGWDGTPAALEDWQSVTLDGWLPGLHLPGLARFVPARRGSHMNLEVPDAELESLEDLLDEIKTQTLRRGQP